MFEQPKRLAKLSVERNVNFSIRLMLLGSVWDPGTLNFSYSHIEMQCFRQKFSFNLKKIVQMQILHTKNALNSLL
jgi:hypothetical protein